MDARRKKRRALMLIYTNRWYFTTGQYTTATHAMPCRSRIAVVVSAECSLRTKYVMIAEQKSGKRLRGRIESTHDDGEQLVVI